MKKLTIGGLILMAFLALGCGLTKESHHEEQKLPAPGPITKSANSTPPTPIKPSNAAQASLTEKLHSEAKLHPDKVYTAQVGGKSIRCIELDGKEYNLETGQRIYRSKKNIHLKPHGEELHHFK